LGKWIICSAWPYINAIPHLGTFIHLLTADVYSRFLKLMGEEVISVSGSDEHGTPIEVEAIKQNISPKELTDRNHKIMLELLDVYGIELSNYTRTESKVHIEFVQEFYKKLEENGYIYTKKSTQLYCNFCKRFLPDRFVEGICPYCGYQNARGDQCDKCGRLLEPTMLKNPYCVICKNRPIKKETTHWYFDLPAFKDVIKKYIENNKQLPENARNFSLQWLKEGLKERAVTRDNKWGIPAPFRGAENKTIYVWMEAVLGYLSAVKELGIKVGDETLFDRFWKDPRTKTVFFIGKDNIPFHTIVFPALLLASGDNYVLPWQVSSTEFILFEGMKFSKSRGIGVWMDEAKNIADPEYWRFVLMAIRPEVKDSNFTWKEFKQIINNDLNDVLGNFVHRSLSFTYKYMKGIVPKPNDIDLDDNNFAKTVMDLREKYVNCMYNFRIREATRLVIETARRGNEYLSKKRPWEALSSKNVSTVIYNVIQTSAHLALMLYPFMPKASTTILSILNLRDLYQKPRFIRKWEIVKPGTKIEKPFPVFRKINLQRT